MTDKPRVVSACMKRIIRANGRTQKPLISGSLTATLGDDLAYKSGSFDGRCIAEVRGGHLLIRWNGPAGYCWKLLLRHLNITPCEHDNYGFQLIRPDTKTPIVSIITDNETDYHHWTTTIAGQLLSQTPLENIKYLDILGIVKDEPPYRRHSSIDAPTRILSKQKKTSLDMQEVNNNSILPLFSSRMFKKNVSNLPDLIRECERSRGSHLDEFYNYVPVKQKRMMFESSLRCTSQSVNDLHYIPISHHNNTKSKSLNNLNQSSVPVKDICRYFESKFNVNEKSSMQFRSLH
ncbi:uncharacterized protein LOC126895195 [Daktulosphaira vitifoliae]|uniref:uncharacterized protein LOC126895195 n=1 Tax=Daktulosphaira vitifoliae TaxID=58002 RepID=UPI0021AAE4AB|nr:uncharacterized protein LOC126895195 [Daktulosphaira vitifoliae]